ncbi:MAG: asparaginase [Bacteriovoracaceae bacterium]|nr:asparaginase [Bacteriovoracaceae bacterium]
MQKQQLFVLTTGGTIEKTYDEEVGSIENRETVIQANILKRLRLPYTKIDVKYVMNKDSLEMDDQDRNIIFQALSRFLSYQAPVVIVHGTDTMTVTAEYCMQQLPKPPVAVVFTGAMKPLGFDDSDATQNVTEALLAAKLLAPGYYICFHNQVFTVPHVRKNKEKRTFESLN